MKTFLQKIVTAFFGSHLDFRARLFNIMAVSGGLIGAIMSVMNLVSRAGLADLLLCASTTVISAAILWYVSVSRNYRVCYLITIAVMFLCIFPMMFFSVDGYNSGMTSFFIFAVLFTVFMLKGRMMIIMSVLELVVYTAICAAAYLNDGLVTPFENRLGGFIDIVFSFLLVSIVLGITMALHFRLYDEQQRKLEAACRQAEEFSKMKSDLFSMVSHEMRTPLAVMSTFAQYAVEQIRDGNINEETLSDISAISEEAERLAELASSTLGVFKNMSGAGAADGRPNIPVDIGSLAKRLVRLLTPMAERKGAKLSADIGDGVRPISGDDGALTQLLWNILQNAVVHSGAESIRLVMETSRDTVDGSAPPLHITVEDDGGGIALDLLPCVFDYGVSSSPESNGIGLYICREIVKRHGGEIAIASAHCDGKGTRVTVSLPG